MCVNYHYWYSTDYNLLCRAPFLKVQPFLKAHQNHLGTLLKMQTSRSRSSETASLDIGSTM